MPNRRAFTLIEIVMAVSILMLLLLLAVPSLNGVLADRRLRRSLDKFSGIVHQAQERSIAEHRPYLIVWGRKSIEVRPESFMKNEEEKSVAQFDMGRNDVLKLILPVALVKEPPAEWIFWPSGACEPATVKFTGRDGTWTANFSALSSLPEMISYVVR